MENLRKLSNFIGSFIGVNNKIIIFDSKQAIDYTQVDVPESLKLKNTRIKYFENQITDERGRCFYYSDPDYFLEYFGTGIWKEGICIGIVILGPFIVSEIDKFKLRRLPKRKDLCTEEEAVLKSFYKKLIHSETKSLNMIGELIINLNIENYIFPSFADDMEELEKKEPEQEIKLNESEDITEVRYQYEEEFIKAITDGDEKRAVESYLSHMNYFDFTNRLQGKNIRGLKNALVIMNTLSRKAAQSGGLPPKYLHYISEKVAREIEGTNNIHFLKNLRITIIREYSRAVREYSIKGYSDPVAKAMDYIYSNLDKKIGLGDIAEKTFISSSHLSRKFKEETGYTVTEYINLKKIEKSKVLFQEENNINNVAYMLGFSEESYFNKVFKKYTGTTPAKYVKSLRCNHND